MEWPQLSEPRPSPSPRSTSKSGSNRCSTTRSSSESKIAPRRVAAVDRPAPEPAGPVADAVPDRPGRGGRAAARAASSPAIPGRRDFEAALRHYALTEEDCRSFLVESIAFERYVAFRFKTGLNAGQPASKPTTGTNTPAHAARGASRLRLWKKCRTRSLGSSLSARQRLCWKSACLNSGRSTESNCG